jgi:ribosomal protein S5
MKKNYLFLALLFSSVMFGQAIIFNNSGGTGNGKWSTASNWIGGVLPTASATINANVDLDIPVTLSASIQGATSTVIGTGKLTLTGAATGAGIIATGTNFTYDGLVEINTGSATVIKILQVNNTIATAPAVTPNRQLTFGPESVLTLTTPARVNPQVPAFSKVVFQGKIDGSASMQFNGSTEFATTSDNSAYNGDFVFFGADATIISNTTGNGAFLKAGRKVQVNAADCSLTLNGANSYKGNLILAPANSFTLNVNANQEAFGTVTVGNSQLKINVATAVTNLSFADSAGLTWGTGTIAITGYQSGEIRFGANKNALTTEQLAKITADGTAAGKDLALDANGYLILASDVVVDPSSTFNNAGGAGNGKWSTVTNWTTGALPTATATINANVDLDIPVTLSTAVQGATTTVSGAGKLTLTGATTGVGILATGANFTYNAAAEVNTGSATVIKFLQVNNGTALNRQLTFGPQSVLTLTTPARVNTQLPLLSKVLFQGKIEGSANLQFSGTSEFAATSDNSNYNGDFVFFAADGTITANTTGDGAFLKSGRKVQVNANNCTLNLNGANSCKGHIVSAAATNFSLNVNANQESFGFLGNGNGTLTINVAPGVTNLSFANSATAVWGTGTIAFTGYQSKKIRFGTSNDALTADQLAKITADGTAAGQALGLDAEGYLVLASLSSQSFAKENKIAISYPTHVDNMIYFSKPQRNIEIFNVNGNKVFKTSSKNGIDSITASEFSTGIYFIVFDGAKVEKFVKK